MTTPPRRPNRTGGRRTVSRTVLGCALAGSLVAACSTTDGESSESSSTSATSSTSASGSDTSQPSTTGASDTAGGALPAEVQAAIDSDDFDTARWGLSVVPVGGGDSVYELDAGKISAMGSNAKLYTVGTWLDAYGADHTIETPVYALGEVSDGALDGPLVLRAMGDLVMGGRNAGDAELGYSIPPQPDANGLPGAQPAPGDPLAGLNDLATQVAAAGISQIDGDVIIDDRLFEEWETPRPETVTPIVINDNLMAIVTSPTEEGDPGDLRIVPDTSAFTIDNQTETIGAGGDTQVTIDPVLDDNGEPTNTLVVSGQIAADADPLLRVYEVPDPASFARTLFIEALERAGVSAATDRLQVNDAESLVPAEEYEGADQPVATLTSPPLIDIATLILKISHNLGADLAVCLLAADQGSTDCLDGFAPIRERIGDLGIDQGEVWMIDGSGSGFASTTASAMTTWIQWMHSLEWGDQLPQMLPIMGVDGSLALTHTDDPATGKVQGKTGTWAGIDPGSGRLLIMDQSVAGLIEAEDGQQYAFAVYMNGDSRDSIAGIFDVQDGVVDVPAALQQAL